MRTGRDIYYTNAHGFNDYSEDGMLVTSAGQSREAYNIADEVDRRFIYLDLRTADNGVIYGDSCFTCLE